jgi:hypothetical protein
MRRILLDEGVSVGLRRYLSGFSVEVVAEIGWAGRTNGDLLEAAERAGFDVMVTADQNIRHQQNLTGRKLALVVLGINHWPTIRAAVDRVLQAVTIATPGSYQAIPFNRPALRRRPFNPPHDG